MGGAKSKFEQTDWVRANGKLESEKNPTIDGSRPTSSYAVYYITKTRLNQREFTVTDLDLNLLYTTKIVPGTLCWFDVYGRGINDCLLRVQVDLSRRFWVVYRMGIPCFSGQLADREATDKLANDRRENGDDLTATPFLFRKCCIAVSWSRYMAVAMQYGPPEGIDHLSNHPTDESQSASESFFNNAKQITARMRKSASSISALSSGVDNDEEEKKGEEAEVENTPQHNPSEDDDDQCDQPAQLMYDATNSSHHGSTGSIGTEDDPDESQPNNSRNSLSAWVQKQHQLIKDNKKRKLKTDPLEGILHLDRPLLLCQEIYDKLIGNHQTSVLSRERAIELLREDIEQHKNDGELEGDNLPFMANQEQIFEHLEALRKLEEEQKNAASQESTKEDNSSEEDKQQEDINESEERTSSQENTNNGGNAADEGDNNHVHPKVNIGAQRQREGDDQQATHQQLQGESQVESIPAEQPKFNGEINHVETKETTTSAADDGNQTDDKTEKEENEKEDLVAYWAWENTWTTHQMKVHVAAGSDLALHVVMAIIVNQVRYERNAIAMTI